MTTLLPASSLVDLSGRVALVTGGAKGIGLGIARRLADAGASVLVTDVDDAAGAVAGQAVGAYLHADGGSVADAGRAVDACYERWGRLDVLVNNAGIFPACPALEISEELWGRVMDVNLKGAFFYAQAAARRMIAAGSAGSIVNIASIDAFHPSGSLVHYDASKAGMAMMTRSLAAELGRHRIRVNTVAPGAIRTPGAEAAMGRIGAAMGITGEQMAQGFLARVPLARMGEPDDIAAAALFFASDASAYVTGASLVVDGGYLVS